MSGVFYLHDYGLREVTSRDSSIILHWRNSDHIRTASFNDRLMTEQEHQQWFDSARSDRKAKYLIFESKQVSMGLVMFSHIDKRHNTAQWGFYLGDTELPKGTGTVLTYLGLEYAFTKLQIRKISAEVLAGNVKSLRLHEKLGFAEEGRFREHICKGGVLHDVFVFALFAHDWLTKFRSIVGSSLFVDDIQEPTIGGLPNNSRTNSQLGPCSG